MVIGPVADDDTRVIIEAYQKGIYGYDEVAGLTAVRLLKTNVLSDQYFIGSEKAIDKLEYAGIM